MTIRLLFALLLGLFFQFSALAESFAGRVVGVSDGDTISVMKSGKAVKVRLHGVDAPESSQAFGTRARQKTSELVFGQEVTVHVETLDRYGRIVGKVILPDGRSLNRELVRSGLAWWYRDYARKDKELERLEREAREERRGLWADPDPTPPWLFRKNNRRPGAEQSQDPGPATKGLASANRTTSTPQPVAADSPAPADPVYVTARANRYHRATCKSIAGRAEAIPLAQARARGIRPCGTCKP